LSDADILELHRIGSGGLLPDRTLLIEVPAAVTAKRLAERDGDESDRIGGRSAEYHARVAEAFSKLANVEPQRFARIDGQGSPSEIHTRVLASVAQLIDKTA
jgi:dTMP kinase